MLLSGTESEEELSDVTAANLFHTAVIILVWNGGQRAFSLEDLICQGTPVNAIWLMFVGQCIILIVEEWKTKLMSLAILFHFLCAQHVLDINISIIRSLRLCCWITMSVVFFSVRCVLEIWCGLCFSLQHGHHSTPQITYFCDLLWTCGSNMFWERRGFRAAA